MSDKSDSQQPPKTDNLDLSGLSSLSLGPDWVSGKPARQKIPKKFEEGERSDKRGPKGPRKDRRGSGMERRGSGPGRRREEGDRGERSGRGERPEPFSPVVDVDFYPEEEPFKVMTQAIRNSGRTFELFEIARLILEKPDRFVCVVKDPRQKEGEPALLYASVPDGLPFRSEEAALSHTIRHYMDEFFTMEEVEVEAPSGTFQMVHKCGLTGEVLSPPNYHRYQAICREHHATKLSHLPYERFEQKLESSREEEDLSAWMEKMKKQTRFTSKEDPTLVFNSLEDARLHLLTQARDKLVRPAYSARFSGKALALLNPGDMIRRSVEFHLEGQKRFPLDTANHLRGRLRRVHFAVYKRGSKGVSFVCAVKRRFRSPGETFADNLNDLIGFLEAHPNFPAKDLPRSYLGIRPIVAKPEAASTEVAQEVAKEMGSPEAAEAAKESAPKISEADQARIRQLKNDLHYLVTEGYVTEYSDGRLYIPPVREEGTPKAKAEESEKAAEAAVSAEATESGPVDASASEAKEEPEATSEGEEAVVEASAELPEADIVVETSAVAEASAVVEPSAQEEQAAESPFDEESVSTDEETAAAEAEASCKEAEDPSTSDEAAATEASEAPSPEAIPTEEAAEAEPSVADADVAEEKVESGEDADESDAGEKSTS